MLVYLPRDYDHIIKYHLETNDDARIEDILSDFYASGLAPYEYDGIGTGGKVTDVYRNEGSLEDGKWYMILSNNHHRTKVIMKRGKK